MLFRQLFDAETSTFTYLLADKGQAILIDPVAHLVDRDLGLVADLGLELVFVLETHVHADHVTAAGVIRQRTGAKVALGKDTGVTTADLLLDDGDSLRFGDFTLEARLTPGHTAGDVSYVLADAGMAFTGDALLIRGCGRTDFQEGDASQLYRSVHEKILSLPRSTLLYPGHDYRGLTVTTVDEERRLNPRLRDDIDEAAFVEIMAQLKLSPPKNINEALPANLRLGLGA